MAFLAHLTGLDRTGDDGVSRRDELAASARKGNEIAQRKLDGPEFPESLGYLYDWFRELQSGRTCDNSGIAALTYRDVEAWARLSLNDPLPHEAKALLTLDAVWRDALRDEQKPAGVQAKEEQAQPTERPAWPMKKVS